MEPISAHSTRPPVLRPATALSADLQAVLREGQVLAGEVLDTLDGGSVLIGLGRHRVPAQSHVALALGQRLLLEVAAGEAGIELRLLGQARPETGAARLLDLLRAAVGKEQPAGPRLEALAQALERVAAAGSDGKVESLLGAVREQALAPGIEGALLRAKVLASGLAAEARLLDLALAGAPPGPRAELGRRAKDALLAAVRAAVPEAPPAAELEAALRELASARSSALAALPEPEVEAQLARELALLVRAALRGAKPPAPGAARSEAGGAPARLAAELTSALPTAGLRELAVRALLGLAEPGLSGVAGAAPAALEALAGDFKLALARASLELPSGPARDAAAQALAALEADQLANVARRAAGEPIHLGLPFFDGRTWTTVHLLQEPPERRGQRGAGSGRLSLAVDFEALGPIRADLALSPGRLAVRLAVLRPETRGALVALEAELAARLARGGREVALAIGASAHEPGDPEPAERPFDTHLLREHHLLDRSG